MELREERHNKLPDMREKRCEWCSGCAEGCRGKVAGYETEIRDRSTGLHGIGVHVRDDKATGIVIYITC